MSTLEAVEHDRGAEKPCLNTEKAVEVPQSTVESTSDKPPVSEPTSDKPSWLVGDIVWAKIPGHPWWPSMVAYEPNTAVYFKFKGRAKYYHVQFFGTEPMRGWAAERSVLKYEGKTHFLSLRLSVHGKPHKIGNKQLPFWETAVKMADKGLPLNRHERQLCFTFKYTEKSSSEQEDKIPFASTLAHKKTKVSSSPEDSVDKICNGSDCVFEPPVKKSKVDKNDVLSITDTKLATKKLKNIGKKGKQTTPNIKQTTPKQRKTTPGKQANKLKKQNKNKDEKQSNNKLDKKVNSKLNEQTNNKVDKQMKKKEMKEKLLVNHTPTSCTFQMNINPNTPENGKRKRGRPPKNLMFVSASPGADVMVKKPKIEKNCQKVAMNNISCLSGESSQSDVASDTNSVSSIDTDNRSNKFTLKPKECVCTVCEQPDDLLICEGICGSAYHKDCLGLSCDALPEKFVCDECMSGNHTCFICKKTNNVLKCSVQNCGKFYHLDCIKTVDAVIKDETFICPLHHCNVCGPRKTGKKRRLTCCTRCPVAYHNGTCIVAGSLPITSQFLVCKRHFLADKKKAHHSHVNVNWCFVCSIGGTLICCESCPAAFHPECIEETGIPEGSFFCRDCKDGKELLYGEIVWVKLGMYRWWPAQICNPSNIPTNIQNMQHQPGEFPVQFLGSHDYYWIHRGRVFSYQEGDKGSQSGGKYLAGIFNKALDEAKEKYAKWQEAQEEEAEKALEKLSKKPAVYRHIKVNRYTTATRYVIDEPEWSTCDCSSNDENPCGPDSHCINRILFVECSPLKCRAKERCQNQCFVKRQDLDCEPFRAEKRGWGLKAKADAKKGQFVIEYVGELINEETCRERVRKGINDGVINYYMLTIDKDCIIDAGPMGNLSRFMNHSCNPNCETQKWNVNGEVRVGLFAKRDIKAGEELVFDYQLDCLGNEKKKCCCGSENCSGFLGVRPKTQHALLQEEKKKNQDSKKKKKKNTNKKNQTIDEHEDECFDCGDGGELIMCSKSGCSKCYHLSCLTLDKVPYGDWLCPWHFCDDCGKAATVRCDECSNSFCFAHALGQITKTADGRQLCGSHPLDTSNVKNPENTPSDPTPCKPQQTSNVLTDPTIPLDPTPNSSTVPTNVLTSSLDAPLKAANAPIPLTNESKIPTDQVINSTDVFLKSNSAPMTHAVDSLDPTNNSPSTMPKIIPADLAKNPISVCKDPLSFLTDCVLKYPTNVPKILDSDVSKANELALPTL